MPLSNITTTKKISGVQKPSRPAEAGAILADDDCLENGRMATIRANLIFLVSKISPDLTHTIRNKSSVKY
jgi:hypothetical protein